MSDIEAKKFEKNKNYKMLLNCVDLMKVLKN